MLYRVRRCIYIVLLFTLVMITFNEEYPENIKRLPKNLEISRDERPANILFWTPYQHEKTEWNHIFGRLLNNECPENRCNLLFDRKQVDQADAVVFSNVYMNRDNDFLTPDTHPTYQYWVMLSFEGHLSLRGKHEKDTDYSIRGGPGHPVWEYQVTEMSKMGLNWTMHFRRDADVEVPYGIVRQIQNGTQNKELVDYWSTKDPTKTALWMTSHCNTASDREGYVDDLKKFIRVDVYGKCGKLKCGTTNLVIQKAKWDYDRCTQVTKKYMFYLAFENRLVKDYVSEKFWRALNQDVVPVVLGGADYNAYAPPNSYINALDFPSPEALAEHLKLVSTNSKLYNRYFEWKKYYTVEQGHPYKSMTCRLCEKLHEVRKSPPTPKVFDLRSWIYEDGWLGSWKNALKQKLPK